MLTFTVRSGRAALAAAALAGSLLSPAMARAEDATPAACADLDRTAMLAAATAWTDHSFVTANAAEFEAALAPDLVYHSAAFGDVDLQGWIAGRAVLEEAYPGGTIAVNEAIVDGPWVVTQWTATGVWSGPFMGTPPSGDPVEWDGINVYRFDCGKIAEAWTSLDQYGRNDPVTPEAANPATPAASCATAGEPVAEAEAIALLSQWWADGWNSGNAAAADAVTASDVLHHWAMGPDTVGDAAIAAQIASWRAAMPDLVITPAEIVVEGDLAAARWTATGANTGGIMGNAPTGKSATWNGINVFRIQCGEIVEIWSEMDAMGMTAQLGA